MATLMRIIRNSKTWWKKSFVVFLVIALIGSVAILPAKTAKADDGLELFYTVTVEKGKDTIHIDIEVKNVNQDELDFAFTNSASPIFDSSRDTFIFNVNAITKNQSNLKINHAEGSLVWKIRTANIHNFTLSYDIPKILYYTYTDDYNELFTYIDDNGGFLKPELIFMYTSSKVDVVQLKLNVPKGWIIVAPYWDLGNGTYQVPNITGNPEIDLIKRISVYFGKMKYFSEKEVEGSNCIVKFGVLANDERSGICGYSSSNPQQDIDLLVNRTAEITNFFTKMFGDNPYPVIAIASTPGYDIPNYGWLQFNAHQVHYWSPRRYDEMVGHLIAWWMSKNPDFSPAFCEKWIGSGLLEEYLGNKLAYKQTGDKAYLGNIYSHYIVWQRASKTIDYRNREEAQQYYKGAVFGLYLDNLIQKETNNSKSIEDVIAYLYKKYKRTGHKINDEDIKNTVNFITQKNNDSIFKEYLLGNQEIPVSDIIESYKEAFSEFIKVLNSDNWFANQFHGYTVPFLINIEIALAKPGHLPEQIVITSYYRNFAASIAENYNIDDLTEKEVEYTLSKLTGQDESKFFEIWKNIYPITLQEIKDWLKSYLPYAPQNITALFKGNAVVLNWDPVEWRYPSGYYRITGYNIYRGTVPEKEKKIATVTGTNYTDTNVETGKTYYYYIESIEDQPFRDGIHISSEPSKEIKISTKDTTPPEIKINSPIDISVVDINIVSISGMAIDAESGIEKVTINSSEVSVASNGSFSKTVNLTEGTNKITIVATDKAGNKTTKTIRLSYTPPVKTITITLQPDNPYMTVNGIQQEIDPGRGTKPVIIPKWSRTVVPIRAIVEVLGGTIEWNGTERKVTINFNETTIELWIDNPKARVNGTAKWIDENNHDVKPIIINSRTMLPLRFVVENLGCDVNWDPTTKTITITYIP